MQNKRKFLMIDPSILGGRQGFLIVNGYLQEDSPLILVRTFGSFAFVSIEAKSVKSPEQRFEYPIPVEDALAMLECHCAARLVSKTRHLITHGDDVFEIDVYAGRLAGLMTAEITPIDLSGRFESPSWLGTEITGHPDFTDFALMHAQSAPRMSALELGPV